MAQKKIVAKIAADRLIIAIFGGMIAAFLPAFAPAAQAAAAPTPTAGTPVPSATAPPAPGASVSLYLIQPGDILAVSVWKEPDLQAELLVRPDGGISFPLAGDMLAAGRSVEDVRQNIERNLKKYIPDPAVTVMVKQIGGNYIYVIGKVNRPGQYTFAKQLDVMQALSLAGGATPYADVNDIRILQRDAKGALRSTSFRYTEVEKGKSLDQNIQLKSGDTVVVP